MKLFRTILDRKWSSSTSALVQKSVQILVHESSPESRVQLLQRPPEKVITVKVLITAPKKIIQDTTYNVRRESEFICTLIAYWRLH